MTKEEQHKLDASKLDTLELELVYLIAKTDNESLMTKFLEWQDQRIKCNMGFMSILHSKLDG